MIHDREVLVYSSCIMLFYYIALYYSV